jgi:ComEC/Rec2-related protein
MTFNQSGFVMNPLFLTRMHYITTYIKKYHPDLLLWTRFPGLVSFTGIIAGIWISSAIPQYSIIHNYPLLFGFATAAVISVAVLIKKNNIQFILFLLAGVLIFQIKLQSFCIQASEINSFCTDHDDVYVCGIVVSNPAPTQNYSFTFLLKTDSITTADSALRIGKTFICQGPQAPLYGSVITVQGKVTSPTRKNIPFVFDDFSYLFSNDIFARVTFDNFEVRQRTPSGVTRINAITRNYVLEVISNLTNVDYRSVLRAAFIGENRFLSEEIKQKFRKSGIYHLLAISGLHAAILTAAAFAFLFLIPVNNNIKRSAVIVILWLYQLFIGWQPSLLRATIMASMMIAAFLYEKKQYTLQSLGIAGTVILFLSPAALFSPGFQLSFAATAGIVMLYPRLATFKAGFGSPFIQALTGHLYTSFSISLCGFLFTAPVLIYHFGTVSFFGLIANIAAVVIMTSAMWLFFISLLLQPFIPVAVLALSRVLSLHFDALFGIADLANILPLSDFQLPIPGTIIIVVYLSVLIGIATIKKHYLGRFCLITIPLFTLLVSGKMAFDLLSMDIHILQYTDTSSSWSSIRWPGGNVWIINYQLSRSKKSNQDKIVTQWMRRFPGSHLESVFNAGNTQSSSKSHSSPKPIRPDEGILVRDSLLLDCPCSKNAAQTSRCVLYNRQSPIQLRILYASDTFVVERPPLQTYDQSVLLKTLH